MKWAMPPSSNTAPACTKNCELSAKKYSGCRGGLTGFSAFGKFLPWHPASPLSKPYATTLTDMRWTMFVLGSLQGLVHCPDRITPLHITAGDHDDVS
jgi:hypothetical protein